MAATQKRWLTASNGKLSKVDIVEILRKDEAWALLPQETRQHLYSLLPPPREGEAEYDPDIHPLNTSLKKYIEEELRKWQNDLIDGREAKTWREKAMLAGQEREEGKWDEWKQQQREEDWGKPDENVEPKPEASGDQGEDEVHENGMAETEVKEGKAEDVTIDR